MNKSRTNFLSYMLQMMKHIVIVLIILYIISIILLQMNFLPASIANIVNHIKSVEVTVISIIGLLAYIWKLSKNLITIIFDAIIAIILIVFVLRPPLPFPLYPPFGATPMHSPSYFPSGMTPTLYNPLSADNGERWYSGVAKDGSSCSFMGGAYHASVPQPGYFHPCVMRSSIFSNFIYEVHMTIIKGDCGGLLFRIHNQDSNFYNFLICQDGTYKLGLSMKNAPQKELILSQHSPVIHRGLNQSNTIAVKASGQKFDLYINGQKVASVSDGTYDSGFIGVYAKEMGNPTEVIFSDVKVWKQ